MLPVYMIHWNAPDWCVASVSSLQSSTVPVAVTVIDNASRTVPDVPGVTIVRLPENTGYTGGANAGLRAWLGTSDEWCVLCSHDLDVEPRTLELMLSAVAEHPEVGIVGPDLPAREHQPVLRVDGPLQVREWVPGCCMLIRRACVDQVGRFDESFGSYCEDVDYCWRARAAGWTVCSVEGARARGLGVADPIAAKRLMLVNQVRLMVKHRGRRAGARAVALIARRLAGSCRRGRWGDARTSLGALASGARHVLTG